MGLKIEGHRASAATSRHPLRYATSKNSYLPPDFEHRQIVGLKKEGQRLGAELAAVSSDLKSTSAERDQLLEYAGNDIAANGGDTHRSGAAASPGGTAWSC